MVGLRCAGICSKLGPRLRTQRHQTVVTAITPHIRRDAVGKAIAEAVTDIDYIKLQEQY